MISGSTGTRDSSAMSASPPDHPGNIGPVRRAAAKRQLHRGVAEHRRQLDDGACPFRIRQNSADRHDPEKSATLPGGASSRTRRTQGGETAPERPPPAHRAAIPGPPGSVVGSGQKERRQVARRRLVIAEGDNETSHSRTKEKNASPAAAQRVRAQCEATVENHSTGSRQGSNQGQTQPS